MIQHLLQKGRQIGEPTAARRNQGEIELERGHGVRVGLNRGDPSHVIWFVLKLNKNRTASDAARLLLAQYEQLAGDALQERARHQHVRAVQVVAFRLLDLLLDASRQFGDRLQVRLIGTAAAIRYPIVVVVAAIIVLLLLLLLPVDVLSLLACRHWRRRRPLERALPV